jgi:hypothetical protein
MDPAFRRDDGSVGGQSYIIIPEMSLLSYSAQ